MCVSMPTARFSFNPSKMRDFKRILRGRSRYGMRPMVALRDYSPTPSVYCSGSRVIVAVSRAFQELGNYANVMPLRLEYFVDVRKPFDKVKPARRLMAAIFKALELGYYVVLDRNIVTSFPIVRTTPSRRCDGYYAGRLTFSRILNDDERDYSEKISINIGRS